MSLLQTIKDQERLGVDLDSPAYAYPESMSSLDLEILLDVAERLNIGGYVYGDYRHNLNL